jgi:magnesium transporter
VNPTAQLLAPEIVELVSEGRWSELRDILHELPFADVADILADIEPEQAALAFRFLPRDDAGEVFSYLEQEKQEELIRELGNEAAASVVEAMSADDRARLLDELPGPVASRIVASLSPEERSVTQAILGYPPRSVGRLMTPDYIRVRTEWTCATALEHIRRFGKDAETINVLYVVDEQGKLVDDVHLRKVLLSEPGTRIEDLMNGTYYALRADQPQEEAVQMMSRYDRSALPVVDSFNILVGIVTADDVADVAQAEATEDIQKLGAVGALDEPFDDASVFYLVRKRAPWLALLFMSELLTSNTLVYFQSEIERLAILAAFVPAIISSGGNSGSQASTLVIRALAVGEIKLRDWWRVLRREILIAGILGIIIAVLGFARITIWGSLGWWTTKREDPETGEIVVSSFVQDHYVMLAMAIAASLVGVVIWGSLMGSMLPFILKRLGLDPAASSTPFVATLVDVTGILIYFSCAILILRGTLL